MREDDIGGLARELGRACERRGVMVATAESCTGGGVAEAITRIAGCSAWFDRAFITYSNEAKVAMLGVREATLAAHGAVSEAVACEMAAGTLEHSLARVGVAVTGIAGPGGATPGKPVGTVWFAWAASGDAVQARLVRLRGDRQAIRRQAVAVALRGLVDLTR